ncbi:MAG: hypothetical protein HYY57_01575 [Candidatus Omnitrophica bacterium]|nr:hypothetical protein [Candidatus Omnitrophota bacterium]
MPSALLEEFQQRAMPLLGWQKSRQEDTAAEIAKRWALMWAESWQQFVEIVPRRASLARDDPEQVPRLRSGLWPEPVEGQGHTAGSHGPSRGVDAL